MLPEIWYLVAEFLDFISLVRFSIVSKTIYETINPLCKKRYKIENDRALINVKKFIDFHPKEYNYYSDSFQAMILIEDELYLKGELYQLLYMYSYIKIYVPDMEQQFLKYIINAHFEPIFEKKFALFKMMYSNFEYIEWMNSYLTHAIIDESEEICDWLVNRGAKLDSELFYNNLSKNRRRDITLTILQLLYKVTGKIEPPLFLRLCEENNRVAINWIYSVIPDRIKFMREVLNHVTSGNLIMRYA